MPITNYMAQDLLGVFTGVFLFTLVLLIPGYVIGHIFDLFDFKKRQPAVRFGIGLLLSCAICPILFFLTYRLISNTFTLIVLFGFATVFAWIIFHEDGLDIFFKSMAGNRFTRALLGIGVLWTIFAALLLIDVQWGNQLYFNITAYDYSTRALVINAITRTGIPPLNPSYFPGQPVKLTFLYYFWYILCSIVDQLGGEIVDSRAALIASVIWAGLALMATVAIYIRLRSWSGTDKSTQWRLALLGIGLLTVSGLDIFGSTFFMLFPQYLIGHVIEGDIEHWNEQITAWVGTTVWTPHHLVSLLICILGWMLAVYHQDKRLPQRISSATIAGLAFASALGLSSWITLIFVLFWICWIVMRLLKGSLLSSIWILFLPGMIAAICVLPFILDLLGSGSGDSTVLTFDVRSFWPITIFILNLSNWQRMLVNLLALPLNYFLELGFFLLAGAFWYPHCGKDQLEKNPFARGEIILLFISLILATFTRSTLIVNNDFGWRGWIPGQFVLLIWGTDIIRYFWSRYSPTHISLFRKPILSKSVRTVLSTLLVIGFLTSLQDVLLLRMWPILPDTHLINLPQISSSDMYLGKRVYEARTAYAAINGATPMDTIVQFNPEYIMDRPAGLYRTRGTVISTHTLYGVSPEAYEPLMNEVGEIFNTKDADWQDLDGACKHYHIDILIFKYSDPIWEQLPALKAERQPLYDGKYYSVFVCQG